VARLVDQLSSQAPKLAQPGQPDSSSRLPTRSSTAAPVLEVVPSLILGGLHRRCPLVDSRSPARRKGPRPEARPYSNSWGPRRRSAVNSAAQLGYSHRPTQPTRLPTRSMAIQPQSKARKRPCFDYQLTSTTPRERRDRTIAAGGLLELFLTEIARASKTKPCQTFLGRIRNQQSPDRH